MVHISQKYLDEQLTKNAWRLFMRIIGRPTLEKELKDLLSGLFTKSELVLIEKRLAILYLLKSGLSYRRISEILDVSSSTINFVKNGFKKTAKKVKNRKENKKLTSDLIAIFEAIDSMIPTSKRIR